MPTGRECDQWASDARNRTDAPHPGTYYQDLPRTRKRSTSLLNIQIYVHAGICVCTYAHMRIRIYKSILPRPRISRRFRSAVGQVYAQESRDGRAKALPGNAPGFPSLHSGTTYWVLLRSGKSTGNAVRKSVTNQHARNQQISTRAKTAWTTRRDFSPKILTCTYKVRDMLTLKIFPTRRQDSALLFNQVFWF